MLPRRRGKLQNIQVITVMTRTEAAYSDWIVIANGPDIIRAIYTVHWTRFQELDFCEMLKFYVDERRRASERSRLCRGEMRRLYLSFVYSGVRKIRPSWEQKLICSLLVMWLIQQQGEQVVAWATTFFIILHIQLISPESLMPGSRLPLMFTAAFNSLPRSLWCDQSRCHDCTKTWLLSSSVLWCYIQNHPLILVSSALYSLCPMQSKVK